MLYKYKPTNHQVTTNCASVPSIHMCLKLIKCNTKITVVFTENFFPGTVLGKKAANLLTILDSTRLSQILDMYYSDRGIPYEFNFKVTDRQEALDYLYENANISNQVTELKTKRFTNAYSRHM